MSICPGDPEGHQWVLQKQGSDTITVWKTRRTWFNNRIEIQDHRYGWHAETVAVWNMWYCSKCRTFDKEVTIVVVPADFLKQGFALQTEDGFLYPEYTHKEWLRKNARS